MKKISIFLCVALMFFGIAGLAGAVTINVTETFGSGSTSGCEGIACLSGWTLVSGSNSDIGYSDLYNSDNGNRYMWVEDDAIVAARVNTTGFESIALGFDIRSASSNGDHMQIGWAVSSTTPDSWSDFTQLTSIYTWNGTQDWTNYSYNLGSTANNTSNLWIAFYLNDGEGDMLLGDNVRVSGTSSVPEPATMLLLGMGLLGMGFVGRRRFIKKDKM